MKRGCYKLKALVALPDFHNPCLIDKAQRVDLYKNEEACGLDPRPGPPDAISITGKDGEDHPCVWAAATNEFDMPNVGTNAINVQNIKNSGMAVHLYLTKDCVEGGLLGSITDDVCVKTVDVKNEEEGLSNVYYIRVDHDLDIRPMPEPEHGSTAFPPGTILP
ncbi:MAG: hypothetical protein Q9167_002814 [Letrouitia subvulpina]